MRGTYEECLRALRQPATWLGLFTIIACWIGMMFVLSIEHDKAISGAFLQSDNLARLFEDSTVQTFERADRTLLLLRKSLEDNPNHFDLRDWAERTGLVDDLTIQLGVINADGALIATTDANYGGLPLRVGDRESFLAHSVTDADALFISKPTLGRVSGKWSIKLSRRVRRSDGAFGGIIVLSLDTNFIAKFYHALDLASAGTIILRNLDGLTLAALGGTGALLAPLGPQATLLGAVARAPAGHFWGDGTRDGIKRLVSYRVADKFPLIMTVAQAQSDILKAYRSDQSMYIASAIAITLLVLIAIVVGARHQRRLDNVRENLRLTLDYMGQGIIMTDAARNVLVINHQAIDLLRLDESFRIDQPVTEVALSRLLDSYEMGGSIELLNPSDIPGSGSMSGDIKVSQHTLESGVVLEMRTAALHGGGSVRTISDITTRKHAEQEIVDLAHHDILTGLANRVLLHGRIDQAFSRARQHKEGFAILCLDLDRFKAANDRLGHQAGDLLLRQVAERLCKCVRDIDTVARVGGDEFVVLQANIRPSDLAPLAKRIMESVSMPYNINGNAVVISVSVGIALAPTDGDNTDQLLGNADLALYRAKAKGRNAFCFFEPEMGQTALRRNTLELELLDAVAKDEFEVWYQPWLNLTDGAIAGCEALLRWRHPRRGIVGPAEFIPIAEEVGLIGQLGELVLLRACRDAACWPKHMKLAINLSAAQFLSGALVETVCNAVAKSGFEARRLELEITETVLIDDYERTSEALSEFRNLNIGVALDDFGTGYSSLTHLRRLPITRIKIDKSFVAEITTRVDSAAIVCALITLGRTLDVSITAEGVETREQLVILRAAGCTEAQGYLFSKPKPAEEILAMISDFTNIAA